MISGLLILGSVLVLGLLLGWMLPSEDRKADRWARQKRVSYPWGPPPARPEAVAYGGCKDCGMADQSTDYYDRCPVCAKVCENRGGVKSVPKGVGPMVPSADMAGFSMEEISG